MQLLNILKVRALSLTGVGPGHPRIKFLTKRLKGTYMSEFSHVMIDKKPCFDINNVTIVRGNAQNAKLITSFLNNQYWPREPSVAALWMPLNSEYLRFLTEKYSNTGERFLALETEPRTSVCRMIGLSVANTVYPWMVSELEQWGHCTACIPDRHRMYFCAHCLKSPNLFKKYNVPYIFDVEVLGTSADVTGQGVGTLLLQNVLHGAEDMRHPLVQVVAFSNYTAKICEKCGMKLEWSMEYKDFVDYCGQSVFFPRRPHETVSIYAKYFDPLKGGEYPCKPPF